MKQFLLITICAISIIAFAAACKNVNSNASTEQPMEQEQLSAEQEQIVMCKLENLPEEPIFEIVTSMGVIKVKLYAQTPKHRDNFAKLAFSKFYDGILFHRIIPGFMIQTGDPLSKDGDRRVYGTGGPGYTIPAEFVSDYKHLKGALAAARRGDAANPMKESSGSQFYIVQDENGCRHLDGQYTVFGQAIEGLDVIDKIAAVQTDMRDCPLEDVKIITVKIAE